VEPLHLHPWTRLAARTGSRTLVVSFVPLLAIGLAVPTGLLGALPAVVQGAAGVVVVLALLLFAFGMAATTLPRPLSAAPRPFHVPIRGRCRAINSPADRVPSHGTHAFGQTYAIDLVHDPEPGARPTFGGRRAMRRPEEYPSFGRPVHAPADATVVATVDGARDHRCRSNLLGYAYMLVEGMVLQLRGARGLMGNHVVLRLRDGTHLALAHLRRGTLAVAVGDEVRAGDVVGAVGNSGNSSEPHVHLQLMDGPTPATAVGLPFVFLDIARTDELDVPEQADDPALPEADQAFHAGVPARQP
jgi:hypothetical protein